MLSVNIFLIVGSSYFTIMMRALQIIVILPLFEVSMPANAGMVFQYLTDVVSFDYYDIEELADEILQLIPTEPVNYKMETIGISTRQFINNLGTFSAYVALCMLLFAVWIIIATINLLTKNRINNV